MGKISSYTRALVAKLQDVFVVDQTDNNVTATKSVTVEQIGDTIAGTQVHSTLTTSDKTLIGAIKEVAKDKNMADEYDDTHTYNIGDITIYGNTLYICTANNTTGTFDPSKWTATTIDNIIGSLSTLTTTDKSSIVGAVNEVNKGLTKSVFLTTTYNCSYADANTIGYRGTGPDITTLTGYPTGKNILAVVIERSYVENKIYPAITSLDTNTLYTESKNSGTAYIGMRVLYTD